eukprot:2274038-Pyramimonas_sp.AAC.1
MAPRQPRHCRSDTWRLSSVVRTIAKRTQRGHKEDTKRTQEVYSASPRVHNKAACTQQELGEGRAHPGGYGGGEGWRLAGGRR